MGGLAAPAHVAVPCGYGNGTGSGTTGRYLSQDLILWDQMEYWAWSSTLSMAQSYGQAPVAGLLYAKASAPLATRRENYSFFSDFIVTIFSIIRRGRLYMKRTRSYDMKSCIPRDPWHHNFFNGNFGHHMMPLLKRAELQAGLVSAKLRC